MARVEFVGVCVDECAGSISLINLSLVYADFKCYLQITYISLINTTIRRGTYGKVRKLYMSAYIRPKADTDKDFKGDI